MKKPPVDKIDTLLADLWRKNLPTLRERLDLLDLIAASASSGTIPPDSRDEAISIAHKLSGSLGTVAGVAHVEIDAESHLDLVRRLDIRRTPTENLHALSEALGRPVRDLTADLRKSLPTAL